MLINILHPAFTLIFFHLIFRLVLISSLPTLFDIDLGILQRQLVYVYVLRASPSSSPVLGPDPTSYLLPPVYVHMDYPELIWSNGLLLRDVSRDYSEWP
jgi:hypothetical protein